VPELLRLKVRGVTVSQQHKCYKSQFAIALHVRNGRSCSPAGANCQQMLFKCSCSFCVVAICCCPVLLLSFHAASLVCCFPRVLPTTSVASLVLLHIPCSHAQHIVLLRLFYRLIVLSLHAAILWCCSSALCSAVCLTQPCSAMVHC
jgi:hypothetical protein